MAIPGFQAGKGYTVQWWDAYASDPTQLVVGAESVVAEPEGSIVLTVDGLERDLALKVFEPAHNCYLPLALRDTAGRNKEIMRSAGPGSPTAGWPRILIDCHLKGSIVL